MRNTKIVLFELMLCLLVIYGIFILNKKANEKNEMHWYCGSGFVCPGACRSVFLLGMPSGSVCDDPGSYYSRSDSSDYVYPV